MLCIGLDPEIEKLPHGLPRNAEGILQFNKSIIKATAPYAAAYKPNLAFYEALGAEGWRILAETAKAIPPGKLKIADAKRGDIGNTAKMYARAFFDDLGFDALTVNPYMGLDTLKPYLDDRPKAKIFVLACTSNPGYADFENQRLQNGRALYEEVVMRCEQMGYAGQIHYVAGATRPEPLARIRALAPKATLLVPGVGAQGGSLQEVLSTGLTAEGSLLINASRSIIYASSGTDFAEKAGLEARRMAQEINVLAGQANA